MTHVFRRFFKISLNKKARKSAVSSKLELITLEERITPAIFTVLNNNDLGPDSLRRAIVDSNLTIESDTIIFAVTGNITLSSALPAIDKTSTAGTLTITGPGSSILTISGNNGVANRNFNIFTISFGGNLAISGVTVSGAKAGSGGGFNNNGTLNISSSIISGNTAGNGGGIRNQGTHTLLNSTISSNAAPGYGAGISNGSGTLNIANTIIANSTGGSSSDFSGPGTVNLIAGATAANNLITFESVLWATKVTSAALNLGPLQDNTGPTFTMALGVGSVAIGTGSATISNAPPINALDQRGVNRSLTAPSIGAFEIGTLRAALNPTFGAPTSTIDGFTVQITNYDPAFAFSGTATANGTVAINGTGFVTVTGVAPGTSSTATIITTRTGYNSGSGTVTGSSTTTPNAINPIFGTPTSTANGFTVQIINYDPAYTYGGTATANGRVSINNTGLVTVIGVAPGTFSTAFITVTRFGYNPAFGSVTATSLNGTAPNPTFGAANSTANGFTVQITNYDGINYFYGSSVSNGSVSINSGGLITVTSIAPRTSSTVNITTSRNGYNSGFGTFTGTSGNGVDLIPTFGTPSSTTNGFNVQITNYDSAFNFFGTATANGSVSISGTGFVSVTGVAPGTASTATITTTRTNYNPGTGTIAATSINGAALNSTFGVPSSTTNGFTVQIANYNSANYTYSSFVFTGSATINGSGLVTVTGIAPSTSSTVFITTNRVGYNSGTGSVAATSSIGTALNPSFGTPSSTTNGFNVQITNFDAAFTYAGTATAGGSVSINSTGLVAVTGVAIGASSTATITTTRSGYNSGSSTVTASAGPNVQFAAGTDSGGGPVVIVKFTDGSSLSFFAYDPTYTGGVRVALGDLNGDGTNEVICGAGVGGGPNVRVFSVTPSRATMVANFFAFEPVFMGGVYVAAGNLDGNVSASGHGIDDLIVSAGPGGGPRVIAFSGGTNYVSLNAQLCDYFVYSPTFRGGVTVAAGNVFGGVGSPDEIITGAGAGGGPHVRAFQLSNTNTPNSVLEYMAFDPDFRNGIYVSAGDISGDGIDDIFTGSNAESNNPSMVNVHQSNGSNTLLYPFAQFAGGARVGVARDSSNNEYMVVGTGPGVDRSLVKIYNRNLIAIDSLFVFPIEYTGGVFVNTSISS